MVKYFIRYYPGQGWRNENITSSEINVLRKRLIKEYLPKSPQISVYAVTKGMQKDGTYRKPLGMLWRAEGQIYWRSENGSKVYRVSEKTGALLDYDKYWRYI